MDTVIAAVGKLIKTVVASILLIVIGLIVCFLGTIYLLTNMASG